MVLKSLMSCSFSLNWVSMATCSRRTVRCSKSRDCSGGYAGSTYIWALSISLATRRTSSTSASCSVKPCQCRSNPKCQELTWAVSWAAAATTLHPSSVCFLQILTARNASADGHTRMNCSSSGKVRYVCFALKTIGPSGAPAGAGAAICLVSQQRSTGQHGDTRTV
jgi:hypothetical protein